jgi:hypothetical protein
MSGMSRSAAPVNLGSEFNSFLFASIGEDRNETLLTVLSALARSNIDPWDEAARLARLPKEDATKRLAMLIAALPARATVYTDFDKIAARLIELLPRRSGTGPQSLEQEHGNGATIHSRLLMCGFCVFMIVMLGTELILTSNQPQTSVSQAYPAAPVATTQQGQ